MNCPKILKATKVVTDPIFANTSIFLTGSCDVRGAIGVILNGNVVGKIGATEMTREEAEDIENLQKIMKKQIASPEAFDATFGGPIKNSELLMFHGHPEFENESKLVLPGLYLGGPDVFDLIHSHDKIKEKKFRFFFGFSAWGPGQLEAEIKANSWNIQDATLDDLFGPQQDKFNLKSLYSPSMN